MSLYILQPLTRGKEERLFLKNGRNEIGKGKSNDFTLNTPLSADSHCRIVVDGSGANLMSINRHKMTYLNGNPIEYGQPVNLLVGDQIGIGTDISEEALKNLGGPEWENTYLLQLEMIAVNHDTLVISDDDHLSDATVDFDYTNTIKDAAVELSDVDDNEGNDVEAEVLKCNQETTVENLSPNIPTQLPSAVPVIVERQGHDSSTIDDSNISALSNVKIEGNISDEPDSDCYNQIQYDSSDSEKSNVPPYTGCLSDFLANSVAPVDTLAYKSRNGQPQPSTSRADLTDYRRKSRGRPRLSGKENETQKRIERFENERLTSSTQSTISSENKKGRGRPKLSGKENEKKERREREKISSASSRQKTVSSGHRKGRKKRQKSRGNDSSDEVILAKIQLSMPLTPPSSGNELISRNVTHLGVRSRNRPNYCENSDSDDSDSSKDKYKEKTRRKRKCTEPSENIDKGPARKKHNMSKHLFDTDSNESDDECSNDTKFENLFKNYQREKKELIPNTKNTIESVEPNPESSIKNTKKSNNSENNIKTPPTHKYLVQPEPQPSTSYYNDKLYLPKPGQEKLPNLSSTTSFKFVQETNALPLRPSMRGYKNPPILPKAITNIPKPQDEEVLFPQKKLKDLKKTIHILPPICNPHDRRLNRSRLQKKPIQSVQKLRENRALVKEKLKSLEKAKKNANNESSDVFKPTCIPRIKMGQSRNDILLREMERTQTR